MREIKFRGKRIDNSEWVIGDLWTNLTRPEEPLVRISTWVGNDNYEYTVIPETVGQFTGLKDKNGVDIYEGDCIKVTRIFGFHSEFMTEWQKMYNLPSINGIGSLFEGVLVVDIHKGLMLKRFDNDYMEPVFNRKQNQFCYLDMTTCKITGNIHEVKPAVQDSVLNTMLQDPNVKTEEVKAPATETEQEQVPGEATQEETE